jgi:serine/threonine protein kinase
MATTDSPKSFDELSNDLYLRFLQKFERRKEDQHRFAPIGTSKEVLQPDVLRCLFRSLDWPDTTESDLSGEDLIERVNERALYDFLAVLIFSSCTVDEVRTFTTELLVKDTFASDTFALPTQSRTLKLLFKEKVTRDKFLAKQSIFCPVIIHQGREQRVEDPGRRRLPYLEEKRLAQGGYGTVYKVKIAKGHFYDHRNRTSNSVPLEVARKDYVISSQFPAASKEHEVLEKILASDRSCENIVDNFGSLAIGPEKYSLFMPLAICDLSAYMMDYHPIKPSTTQEKAAIILSALGLARGLHFLHHEMKTPQGEDLVCYHMDLKPSNILIFQGQDDRKVWKISDFGMARAKLRKQGDRSEKEKDFNSWFVKRSKPGPAPTPTPTLALHGEGTYLAPESLASISTMKTSSDVWSLGCVLSVLFVYLETGAEGVTRYSEARSDHAKADGVDRFFLRDKGFGPFNGHPVVKDWHERLISSAKRRDHEEGKALKGMLHFLEDNVFRDQSKRCGVTEVGNMLRETYQTYTGLENFDRLTSSRDGPDQDPPMKERVLNRLLRRRAVRENGRLIGRWMLRTANPFKNCEISSDGSLVVFWTDRELTLFTSLSLTNGDVEARPQDQWSLEREDSNWFWKNIRLTNRYLLASTSGGTFQVKGPQYSSWQDPLANVVWAEVLCFRFEEGRIGGCQLCPSEAILLKTTRDSGPCYFV